MAPLQTPKLRIGDWQVDPTAGQIARGAEVVRVEARTMRLLMELAAHAGRTVSIDELLDRVWSGVIVTPDSVYQAVAGLRRILGDDPKRPRYIATVPRLGYRMVAKVEPWSDKPQARRGRAANGVIALGVVLSLGVVALLYGQSRHSTAVTVGVLPFLDLTPGMDDVALADDITEGVVDGLARNPRLRTPSFREAVLLRGKHMPLAQAAKVLHVAYALDGSVRRDGANIRVAARLVRVDDGFVVWSQDLERPLQQAPAIEAAIVSGVGGVLAPGAPR
jgi:DNA-binding winged helix-turn-helix (wHTH) protein/TolB-like protein